MIEDALGKGAVNVERILREADRCVKCGLCLPLCPTYGISANEGESPRGRIALIQGLAEGRLQGSPELAGHLDRCLECRACEAGCPSGVAYGRLIDAARTLQRRRGGSRFRRGLVRAALWLLVNQRPLRATAGLLRLYQRCGLQSLARSLGLLQVTGLAGYDRLLPPLPKPFDLAKTGSSSKPDSGRVSLFTGCVGQIAGGPSLRSAIEVLRHLGQEVRIPPQQGCCGALHQHAGEPEMARRLAQRNQRAFACDPPSEPVVSIDSGCTAHLSEYAQLFGADGKELGPRIQDICAYLSGLEWPKELCLIPLPVRVAVHEPCSLHNVLKQERAAYRLLARIPELKLLELPGNETCCGGAGSYCLTQPKISQALLETKISALRTLTPDILVTSNLGCSLQLSSGIRNAGLDIEVLHPVQLIARQLP